MSTPTPRLTGFEIAVHALADVLALWLLSDVYWSTFINGGGDAAYEGLVAAVALPILALSGLTLAHRFRPASRALRGLWMGLSILVSALGGLLALVLLALMVSGMLYRGPSPDAGAMTAMSGFLVFYPAAGLLMLPLGLNASRIPARLWGRLGWGIVGMAVLPILLFNGLRLFGPDPPPVPYGEEESLPAPARAPDTPRAQPRDHERAPAGGR
jgi:hypothetical protein